MEEEIEKDMTPILIQDLGTRYPTKKSKEKKRYGLYQCQYCSKEFEARSADVKSGNTKSCGCNKWKIKHGMYKTRIYQCWSDMKTRCYCTNNEFYKDYGARGIIVCSQWKEDFTSFYEWALENGYKDTLTIDRINNDGNYEPNNCRWTIKEVQSRNTKDIQRNNTSGFRGVSFDKRRNNYKAVIKIKNKGVYLGAYQTALEAAKVYERYVRLNNLEHNFTPVLNEEELEALNETK